MPIDWNSMQNKWRSRWAEAKIFETNPDASKPKFYITVAYPYPNSPQHIGHGRTYTLADVHARYKRMQGYNVLLPMAFHYTGTPILAMSRRLSEGDKELIDTFKNIYRVSDEDLKKLGEPINIASYFHQEIRQGMIEIGYSIDWRREFTTIDPQYSKFIEWQFQKLSEKGFITRGSHPVGWCPKDGNPVGQHDTVGDVEPEIGEYTLVKFDYDACIIPTATLRPETVFGITNVWINPDAKYVRARVGNEKWVVGKDAIPNLEVMGNKISIESETTGKDFIGKYAVNQFTGVKTPILPAKFVDPKNGTGIVMSVPAHAPYDFQALEDLKNSQATFADMFPSLVEKINPIPIISSDKYSGVPAGQIIKQMGIQRQDDPKLEEATRELYAHEFNLGKMLPNTGNYAGLGVREARDRVKADMVKSGKGTTLYTIINSPVICRCGTECTVKIFENQWFINYGDAGWKELARECLASMSLLPEDIRSEFQYTVGWLREKACARKSGMGTKLPFDKEWIIESLSDSVIYMAYYTIARTIKEKKISAEQLTNDFFDYVFLGQGSVDKVASLSKMDKSTLESIRKEFLYFYPLDSRHSGRDLVPNHLTFFIFNHCAIFPKELWPKKIVVNGAVLMEGKKMSKSFGNIIPLREAIKSYGADPLRVAIMATAELLQDADFGRDLVRTFTERLNRLYSLSQEVAKAGKLNESKLSIADRWLLSRLQRIIMLVTDSMEKLRVREALHHIVYILDQDISWYLKRTASHEDVKASVLRYVTEARVRMLAPFTPYLCEEIWEMLGNKDFVARAPWPKVDQRWADVKAEESEDLVKNVLDDIQSILKVTKIAPKKVILYTSAKWKWDAYLMAIDLSLKGELNVGNLIKMLLKDESLKKRAKEVSSF
ncbi:MAG: leucine--tRNA ligase, partial [Thaumarchaeota archaeon]|nr:leucine--tRNA ligase [Nitrososphaerota archaeon]